MPLDATDIEKITAIIDKATSRIEIDIDKLMPRTEYERRHDELYGRTVKNELSIQEVVKWAMSEHEKLAIKSEAQFNAVNVLLREANKQLDEVKDLFSKKEVDEQVRRNAEKNTTIRYIVTVIVGITIGIALPLAVKALGG